MAVKHKITDKAVIVTFKGKLMGGEETDECHERIKGLIQEGQSNVVIDLSSVKWMNSKGLGMLMACFTSLTNAGGNLKIAGATEKTNSLLMITKLITIFDTYPTVDEAMASL